MKYSEEQLKALKNYDKNVLLSASAGSGKTEILSQKVCEVLKKGIKPNELLVLTFTEKAAFEVKERIKLKIKNESELSSFYSEIESAHIQTFDSFNLYLVKRFCGFLNITKNISILDQSFLDTIINSELDKILDVYYNNKDSKLVQCLARLPDKTGDTLRDTIISFYKFTELLANPEEYIKNYFNLFFNKANFIADFYDFISYIKDLIASVRLCYFYKITSKDYLNVLDEAIEKILKSEPDSFVEEIKNFEYPRNPKKYCDEIDISWLDKGKNILIGIFTFIKSLPVDIDEQFNTLKETKPIIEFIFEIYFKLQNNVNLIKKFINSYTFSDVSQMSLKIVRDKNINSILKSEIKFILVDEYQDTSDIQEEFLNLLNDNNMFMVGDVKQSIYRFRNANCSIFSKKYIEYLTGQNGYLLTMQSNYRSRYEIIKTTNDLFSKIMSLKYGGINYDKRQTLAYGNTIYETLKNTNYKYGVFSLCSQDIDEKDDEQYKKEIDLVCEDIIEKISNGFQIVDKTNNVLSLRNCTYKDFAILCSRGTNFNLYKKEFNKYGIPLNVLKDYTINSGDLFLLVKNIFTYSCYILTNPTSPKAKHAFMSIARSYLCEYSDEKCYEKIISNDYLNDEITLRIKKSIKESNGILEILFNNLCNEFNIVEKLYKIGSVKYNIRDLQIFYQKMQFCSDNGYDLVKFVNYLDEEEKYTIDSNAEDSPSDTACNLMSIHKSKGLEFPIIYIVELGAKFNRKNFKSPIAFSKNFGIFLPNYMGPYVETYRKMLLVINENNELISEQMRLLYVALTRGRELVYLVGYKYEDSDKRTLEISSSLNDLLLSSNFSVQEINKKIKGPSETYVTQSETKTNFNLYDFIPLIKEKKKLKASSSVIFDEDRQQFLSYGTHLHFLFELLDFKTLDTSFIEDEKERNLIEKVLNLQIFENIKAAKVYKEYEYVDYENSIHGSIDLLAIYTDHIDIIDYKLKTIDKEEYTRQLNIYGNYIKKVFNKPIKLYILSIIDRKYIEVNFEEEN